MAKNRNSLPYSRQGTRTWLAGGTLIALLLSLPLLIILGSLFTGADAWSAIFETLQTDYITNTFKLIVGVGLLTLALGVPTAWCLANYRFPGSKFLQWGLILPLTIPSYILAIIYVGIFDFTGPVQSFARSTFEADTAQLFVIDIMNPTGLIIILSLALYPYVFVACRAAFSMQATNHLEAARTLGKSGWSVFSRVAVPMARPAIAGGLFLVLMEVLNDFGAAKYFTVNTFTTEIFRSWFSRLDGLSIAVKLSGLLLVIVLILILLERWQRGRAAFHSGRAQRPIKKVRVSGWQGGLMTFLCALPFLFGFAFPVMQLLYWCSLSFGKMVDAEFLSLLSSSCLLALVGAAGVVVFGLILAYIRRISKTWVSGIISQIAVVGYAIPGAIIAVGALILFGFIDGLISGSDNTGFVLTGTLFVLVFAYIVRFMAVGYNGLDAGFGKINHNLDEAARNLGKGPGVTLFKVHIPLLRQALVGAAIMVFVDILKELPLTLILRPFNFDTLATKTFELANDELVAQSAVPALFIILVGIIPIFLLHKLFSRDKWSG